MAESIAQLAKKVHDRATTLRSYASKPGTHRHIASEIERTAAALLACEEYARELEPAAQDYQHKAIERTRQELQQGKPPTVLVSSVFNKFTFGELIKTLDLIANEKDREALEELAKKGSETAIKLLVILSGAHVLVSIKEVLETGLDLYKTGQAAKFRENQVVLTSNLLAWLEMVSVVCLNWCCAAQQYLLGVQGKGEATDDQLLAMVTMRSLDAWKRATAAP
jgi:hypothetical protein